MMLKGSVNHVAISNHSQLLISDYISFSWNPAPESSSSLPAKIPLKSADPSILGASPLIGALGLATFLLFSWPALEGNVGNMAVDLGFGFSSKYGCLRTSFADGRLPGFKERSDIRSSLPAAVRNGNFDLITVPVV